MYIRSIEPHDLTAVFSLLSQFAEFDGTSDKFKIDMGGLHDAYFGNHRKLHALIAGQEGKLTGILNYHFSYSSFSLKTCLWIEDVFIIEAFRSLGIGSKLFEYARDIALENGCVRLEWLVRKENEQGKKFYKKLGAKVDENTFYVSWDL